MSAGAFRKTANTALHEQSTRHVFAHREPGKIILLDNYSDNHRIIFFSSTLPDTKYARGEHSLNILQQTKYWNKRCKQESSWNVRAEHAPKQRGLWSFMLTEINHFRGIRHYKYIQCYNIWRTGKKKIMKIRCLKVFWYRFPMHTTHGCCAGADLVSREIHGCSLLTWTNVCLFLRCLRNLLSTAKVIRRHFQWDRRGIMSADPVIC